MQTAPSTLELFIQKLTASMNGYTSLVRESIELQKQMDRRIESILTILSTFRASDQVTAERLATLLSEARSSEGDLREIRRMATEVHARLIETSSEVRLVSERQRDWTPTHGIQLQERGEENLPSGSHRGGINLSWKTLNSGTRRLWPLLAGTGLVVAHTVWNWYRNNP